MPDLTAVTASARLELVQLSPNEDATSRRPNTRRFGSELEIVWDERKVDAGRNFETLLQKQEISWAAKNLATNVTTVPSCALLFVEESGQFGQNSPFQRSAMFGWPFCISCDWKHGLNLGLKFVCHFGLRTPLLINPKNRFQFSWLQSGPNPQQFP
jgi:hypothetical protein